MTKDVLDALRGRLAVEDVIGNGELRKGQLTGFVWTKRSGTVVLAANRKYYSLACENPAVAVIVAPPTAVHGAAPDKLVVISRQAEECFYFLHNELLEQDEALADPQIHSTALIEPGAVIGKGAVIGENVRIGANCVLQGPVQIGAGTVVEPGVVVGADGLFAKRIAGDLVQIRHFGGVGIGKECFVHAGAVIVRSAMRGEATRIGDRGHIGVMANVGHDVQIAEEAVLSSNTVIAGRARIGARAWIGASATVSNAISVGEGARVNIGAVCIADVAAGAEVSGNFARSHAIHLKDYLREQRRK